MTLPLGQKQFDFRGRFRFVRLLESRLYPMTTFGDSGQCE